MMMENSVVTRITPRMIGSVTCQNRCQGPAPSIAAASCSSAGTAWSPARIVIAKNGVPRQMLAIMTDEIASTGVPRKLIFCLISPQCFNSHENGLKIGSKSISHPKLLSAVGTMNGIRTAARIALRQGIAVFSTRASPKPSASLKGRSPARK